MTCENARKAPSRNTERTLFAQSAGTCLLCNTNLFFKSSIDARSISITELAHVVAHSDIGPRADPTVSEEDRSSPDNIILICPTCHKKVDKSPADFPVDQLLAKKRMRIAAVELVGGITMFERREQARKSVEALLRKNLSLFQQNGPDPSDGSTSSVEKAELWSQIVRDQIVPNNRLIIALVSVNEHLATEEDQLAAELLRQHTDALEQKHQDHIVIAPAPRFPIQAQSIFEGD